MAASGELHVWRWRSLTSSYSRRAKAIAPSAVGTCSGAPELRR